jgi:hypothetical protein
MFYKKDGESLLQGPMVSMPELTLTADNQAQHTYPINGWYWFDTLDDAINYFAKALLDAETQAKRDKLELLGFTQEQIDLLLAVSV